MKKLVMILAVAFTMGLTASTVSAAPKDKKEKAKTETCAKSATCGKDSKSCCSSVKPAEIPAAKEKK